MKHPDDLPKVYLKSADLHIAGRPAIVSTALGSCVSVTLFNKRLQVGAICHGLLPHCKRKTNCSGDCVDGFRYVDCSIRHMLGQFRSLGIGHREIDVKVFGGADMFAPGTREKATVGAQNIKAALSVIEQEQLNLCKSDVGGVRGRKIFFYTHTGEIFLKRLGLRDPELTEELIKTEQEMPVDRATYRSKDRV